MNDLNDLKCGDWVKCLRPQEGIRANKYYCFKEYVNEAKNLVYLFGVSPKYYTWRFIKATYKEAQDAAGFKMGDEVKILRKPEGEGWPNNWLSSMDEMVGKVGKIESMGAFYNGGIALTIDGAARFAFPFFVLEKVNKESIKINMKTKVYCKNIVEFKALAAAAQEAGLTKSLHVADHNDLIFYVKGNEYGWCAKGSYTDTDDILFSSLFTELISYLVDKVPTLPAEIKVGEYTTKWVTKDNKIVQVRVGCQAVDVETINQIYNTIKTYNG